MHVRDSINFNNPSINKWNGNVFCIRTRGKASSSSSCFFGWKIGSGLWMTTSTQDIIIMINWIQLAFGREQMGWKKRLRLRRRKKMKSKHAADDTTSRKHGETDGFALRPGLEPLFLPCCRFSSEELFDCHGNYQSNSNSSTWDDN